MVTFFEHQKSSFKRNYLRNLIALASADGNLIEDEKSLIAKIGLRRGLKWWQIDQLFIESRMQEVFLPESLANRLNMLYDLMELVYVDRKANQHEIRYIEDLLKSFEMKSELLESLMELFKDGTPAPLDWRDFVDEVCGVSVMA